MQTYRCRRCRQVLGAFVTAVPGLALPFSQQAAMSQLQAAHEHHRDRCPGERESSQEAAPQPAAKAAPIRQLTPEPT